jgi:hypothetical protein
MEDNIEINVKEIGTQDVNATEVVQVRVHL